MRKRVSSAGPLLPGEASTVIRIVGVLFALAGAMRLVGAVIVLLGVIAGTSSLALNLGTVARLAMAGGFGMAYCATGVWLYQARRRGAYLAMGALALDLYGMLRGTGGRPMLAVLVTVASLIGLALAWPHLSASGRDVDGLVTLGRRNG